jgi:hypothetical protein
MYEKNEGSYLVNPAPENKPSNVPAKPKAGDVER